MADADSLEFPTQPYRSRYAAKMNCVDGEIIVSLGADVSQ